VRSGPPSPPGPRPGLWPPAPTDPHPEEVGHLLAACRPFYRDQFLIQVGTGLRSGELLGLRCRRVYPELRRIEVIEVRYEAGRFGRGFKAEPKSPASVRVVPMCEQVRQAIGRQLPAGARPDELVFPGPGGSNGIPRGARTPLSTHNLRRVYQAAVADAGETLVHLDLHGPTTCATPSQLGWRTPVSPRG
jgi:integrase